VADDNPFAGIKLSEQVGIGKLDQRLFAPAPSPPPKAESPASPAQPSPSPPESPAPEEKRPAAPLATRAPAAKSEETQRGLRFNITDEPLYKGTFVFTQDELEALEDLKLELRRHLDQKVTKYDLMRAALHLLLEDHEANGERSYATRKIRRRAA
jgi:hypothetical protein